MSNRVSIPFVPTDDTEIALFEGHDRQVSRWVRFNDDGSVAVVLDHDVREDWLWWVIRDSGGVLVRVPVFGAFAPVLAGSEISAPGPVAFALHSC